MAIIKANNQTLSGITSLPTGLGGKVLQVVTDTATSGTVSTATSYFDINLSLNITPSSTSNKIFLLYTGVNETNAQNSALFVQMLRDSTQIAEHKSINFANGGYYDSKSISKLDEPNSSSQITYKMQGKTDGTITGFNIAGYLGTLTAYEIAG